MQVNLIITSDHGMTSVSDKRVIYLSDCNITANMYTLVDTGPPHLGTTAAILPHPGKLDLIYSKLKNGCHPHMTVYKKEDIPERYHYTHNRRNNTNSCCGRWRMANYIWQASAFRTP